MRPQITPGTSALWTAALAISPAAPATASWPSPTTPIPMTLPASSSRGRTAASRISAVRVVFSWATPWATAAP